MGVPAMGQLGALGQSNVPRFREVDGQTKTRLEHRASPSRRCALSLLAVSRFSSRPLAVNLGRCA